MAFSTFTIVADSRYVNGAIFALFDVIIFNTIVVALCKLQTALVQRRLRHGQRVKLRESRSDAYVGGLMTDGTLPTRALMILHLAMLGLLFSLTLGISGRTEKVQVPVTRRYLTRVAADADTDYIRPKLHPQMFSSCVSQSNTSILFYPNAFDTARNVTLADPYLMRDENDARVNIDVPNMLCQKFGKLPPMLVVNRCGDIPEECENNEIGNDGKLELLPEQGTERRTKKTLVLDVGVPPNTLLLTHRNVHILDDIESVRTYNRLMCKERPAQGEERANDKHYFNCVLGKWNDEDSVFTFRLGQASFEREEAKFNTVLDRSASTEIEFFSTSAEIEVEWDADEKGEALFADGLAVIGQDLIIGRNFLDGIISRAIIAKEVDSAMEILSEKERLVTDVTKIAVVLYGVLALVAVVCLLFMGSCMLWSKKNVGFVEVTSFTGVAALLRREIGCKNPFASDWTEFGIISSRENGKLLYRLRAVQEDEEVVALPSGEVIEV